MEGNFNKHLGSKLRMRRLSLGLTQTKVAQAINVTFQQIQKYEKGTNGISSLRIMQLSNFLKVSITFFFEDFPTYESGKQDTLNDSITDDLNYSFLSKLFIGLSENQKEKIFQVLKNTRSLEKKTG
jgi:transcriptional regulator with XRE-family HTH domain